MDAVQERGNAGLLRSLLWQRAIFPRHYLWFLVLSTLDVLLTVLAIYHGAREANGLAAMLLDRYGSAGLIGLKFTAVPIVVMLCQTVGSLKLDTGRRLADWVVALSAIPVVLATVMILGARLGIF